MTDQQPAEPPPPRVVRLKPSTYKPTKAELEAVIRLPAGTTPEDLARAMLTPVEIVYEDE